LNYIQIAPISEKNHFGRKYHTKYLFINSSLPKKTGIIRCSIYTTVVKVLANGDKLAACAAFECIIACIHQGVTFGTQYY
jgi:hypothetical protein